MATAPTKISVTLPLYTKSGEPLTPGEAESLGLMHLGDVEVEVPIEFDQAIPFDEIQSTVQEEIETSLTGATQAVEADPSMLEGVHHDRCGVIPHLHGPQCHPNCPTCGIVPQAGDGSGVTVPDATSPAPGPNAPEVAS